MKKPRVKLLAVVMSIMLLIGLIPVSAVVLAEGSVPEGLVVVNEAGAPYTLNEANSNDVLIEGIAAANAPANSQLAFYFDTTAVAYDTALGDKNNLAVYLDVWSTIANDWVDLRGSKKEYHYSRIFTRDGVEQVVDGPIAGEDPGSWIVSLPANAAGYLIVDMGELEYADITMLRLRSEWNWNDHLDNKTVQIAKVGYIPPKDGPTPPPTPSEPVETPVKPPKDFVLLDAKGVDHLVNSMEANDFVLDAVNVPDAPIGSKLVFYFDTTSIAYDSSLGDKNNWAIYLDGRARGTDNWLDLHGEKNEYHYTRTFIRDGEEITVTGKIPGDEPDGWVIALPANAQGYITVELGDLDLKDLDAIQVRPEWYWNKHALNQTVLIRNIGYIPGDGTKPDPDDDKKPDVNPDDFPFIPDPEGTPSYYGDNYVVTNHKQQELKIDEGMRNNLTIDLSTNASAPADAQAIVFRFNTTGIVETHTDYTDKDTHASYWCLKSKDGFFSGNIDGGEDAYKYCPFTQVYYWQEQVMNNHGYFNWVNTLPLNARGYVIIRMSDLQEYAQHFLGHSVNVADVELLEMHQEWGWNEDLYNQTLRISDVGYLKDVDTFIKDYQNSFQAEYVKGPLAPGSDLTLKADHVEGTFADLTWNERKDTLRYLVNLYDANGKYIQSERSRQDHMKLEGLKTGTSYKVQVLAMGEEDAVLSASNVVDITTLDANIADYIKGFLEYDSSYTADSVKVSGDTATVFWDWIGGVEYYTVHLYEKTGDDLHFVSRSRVDGEKGEVTLNGLEKGKTYCCQIVSYDMTDSIIFAYAPTEDFQIGTGDGANDADVPATGVATAVGTALLLSVLAGAVLVFTQKKRTIGT